MFDASDILAQGMKWGILEKRSTTTRIESCRLGVRGNPRIKSILASSQGRIGTGRGVYNPVFASVVWPFDKYDIG